MSTLIIGGDSLGNIPDKLQEKGVYVVEHITGRKRGDRKLDVLLKVYKVDLVIVLVDYVSHCIVKNTKEQMKNFESKLIFTKRSWSHMEKHINSFIVENKCI